MENGKHWATQLWLAMQMHYGGIYIANIIFQFLGRNKDILDFLLRKYNWKVKKLVEPKKINENLGTVEKTQLKIEWQM